MDSFILLLNLSNAMCVVNVSITLGPNLDTNLYTIPPKFNALPLDRQHEAKEKVNLLHVINNMLKAPKNGQREEETLFAINSKVSECEL